MSFPSYPSDLPCPQADTVTPFERRQLSAPRRPREARAISRERMWTEQIVFPPMSPIQSEKFWAWWRTELVYGGAWFTSTWPSPRGKIELLRKFIEQPKWAFIPGGFWRLPGVCETREVPELIASVPDGCWHEDFNDGLVDYLIIGGDQFQIINTAYGPSLQVAGGHITGFGSSVSRSIPLGFSTFSSLRFKVRLDSLVTTGGADDGPIIDIRDSALDSIFLFDPAREQFFDALQRPYVQFGSFGFAPVKPSSMEVGVWYQAELALVSGTSWNFTLTNINSSASDTTAMTWVGGQLPDKLVIFDSFSFGGSSTKPGATYDAIAICP